jgi:hypothetical protein
LFSASSVASVGALPASVAFVNATLTATLLSVQAVPVALFTKSRPLVNSSWILYAYSAYPVVSGIEPFTVYVTTSPIFTVVLSAVLLMLGVSDFKFTVVVSASTVTKED